MGHFCSHPLFSPLYVKDSIVRNQESVFIFPINGLAGVRRAPRINWPLVFNVCQYLLPACPLPLQDTDSYTDAEHLQPWVSSPPLFLLLYPACFVMLEETGQTESTTHDLSAVLARLLQNPAP